MANRTLYTAVAGEVYTAANHAKHAKGWIGYNEVTASQTGITSATDLTGLSVTVTLPASRRIKVTGQATVTRTVADGQVLGRIQEGASALGVFAYHNALTEHSGGEVILTPSSGSHTYKLTLERQTGTGTVGIAPAAGNAAFILVEDIGPAS